MWLRSDDGHDARPALYSTPGRSGMATPTFNPVVIKYVDLLMPMLGEPHRRDAWLRTFSDAPEAAIVNSVEEFERAIHKGGVKNRGAYFQQIWNRHLTYRAGSNGADEAEARREEIEAMMS